MDSEGDEAGLERDTAATGAIAQALSPRQVVQLFEAASAREIHIESIPEAALESQMTAATDSLQKSFAGLMLQYAAGDVIDTTTSGKLFRFPMTSVRDFIASTRP